MAKKGDGKGGFLGSLAQRGYKLPRMEFFKKRMVLIRPGKGVPEILGSTKIFGIKRGWAKPREFGLSK